MPIDQSIRVAVIEDSEPLTKVIRRLIDSMDEATCVGTWESAEEGLEAITADPPDVVLMDIDLPGMSGIEATTVLKERASGIEVIILTVYEDDDKIFAALEAGASGYLLKGAIQEIRSAIIEVWTGGAPMNAAIARRVVEAFRSPEQDSKSLVSLSRRETEILGLVAKGMTNKEIAADLEISIETVRVHLKHIYEKLQVRSRTEAAMKFRDAQGPHRPGH